MTPPKAGEPTGRRQRCRTQPSPPRRGPRTATHPLRPARPGAGPHVRGWNYDDGTVTPLPGFSFFAWDTEPLSFGANVFAGADLDENGRTELVVGRGPDPSADTEVKVFTYDGVTVNQWISLEAFPDYTYGTNVAAGRF